MYKLKSVYFYLFLSVVITSCGSKDSDEQRPANFVVNQIQLVDLKTTKSTSKSGPSELKDTAHYFLKVCLKDPAVGNPIRDHEFKATLAGESQTVKTDFDGCFTWFGNIPYSMLKCESYKKEEFRLEGLGNYSGSIQAPLYFNPTNISSKSFFDGRYQTPNKLSADNCNDTKFRISNMSLTRVKNNENLEFNVDMQPMLERTLLDGALHNIKLSSAGEFNVRARIITEINGEKIELTSTESTASLTNQNMKLALVFSMPKIEFPSNDLQYQMELSITPLANEAFKTFVGVIKSNDIFFKQSTKIVEIEESISSQKISPKTIGVSSTNRTSNHIQAKEIIVVSTENIGENDYSQAKTKRLSLKTCFYNNLAQFASEPVANKSIKATIGQKNYKVKLQQNNPETDETGCLNYDLFVDYKLFNSRNWNDETITFTIDNAKSIKRDIQLNPWSKSRVLRDKKYSKITSELIDNNESIIHLDKITYGQLGNVDDSYYVNKYADLFYKKKYFLEFYPFVKYSKSFQEESSLKSLNFGKLNVKISLFALSADKTELKDTDFSKLTLLSATQKSAKVDLSGRLYIEPTLPLEVTDALHLSVKSVLLVEVIPTEGLEGLASRKFVIDFFGTDSKTSKSAFSIANEVTYDQQEHINYFIEKGHAFSKGLDKKLSKDNNSLKLFRENLKDVNKVSFSEFKDLKQVKDSGLDHKSMRVLMQIKDKVPSSIRDSLCNMMNKGTLNYFDRKECKENFYSQIRVKGAEHITGTVNLDDFSRDNDVSKASVIPGSEENDGSINRGYAFMAAKGYRASEAWGTNDSTTESISASLYYDGPPSVFLMTAGVTKSHSAFNEKVNAKMHMMFTRTFSTLTPVKLNYNSISVNFPAYVQRCFLIENLKDNKNSFHVCEDRPRRKLVTEKWYFIGEADAKTHGVLTDGIEVGEKTNLKIIRGEKNFKQVWSMFEKEDTKTVIAEMEDFSLGEKFLEYKKNNALDIGLETTKSSSFPGLLR